MQVFVSFSQHELRNKKKFLKITEIKYRHVKKNCKIKKKKQ